MVTTSMYITIYLHSNDQDLFSTYKNQIMWDYDVYQYLGMHAMWWIFWVIIIFLVFATPYDIPGQRKKKDNPLDILKRRYAGGQIDIEEYEKIKNVLERDN